MNCLIQLLMNMSIGYSKPKGITDAFPSRPFSATVTFSHCGRFLALQLYGRPWPELFTLEKFTATEKPVDNRHEDQRMLLTKREPSSPSINNDTQTSTRISAGLYPNIASGALIISPELGGSSTMTMCHVSSDAVQLHLRRKEGETRISLTKFPQSIPSPFMSAQVGVPDQDDDFPIYRIILNANPLSYYASAQLPISETLPMVIRKDARAVRQCTAKDMIEDSPMKP